MVTDSHRYSKCLELVMRRFLFALAILGCVSIISAVATHSLVALTYAGDTDDDGRRFLLACAVLSGLMVICTEAGYGLVMRRHASAPGPSRCGSR
jgi:hypothetical protein